MTPARVVIGSATGPEPISLDELMALARVDDTELGLMPGFIAAARHTVERKTDLTLVETAVEAWFDAMAPVVVLPYPPLAAIDAVSWIDTDDVPHVVPAGYYIADTVSVPGRLVWTPPADFVPDVDGATPRASQAWHVVYQAGYPAATLPPPLKWAVGALAVNYLVAGRDVLAMGGLPRRCRSGWSMRCSRFAWRRWPDARA